MLAERYRVITYDRRGHSQSERVPGPEGVMAHVADLAGVIEQLDARPAHLVTNSFGGEIALKLALARPELVASLCLHEPPLYRCLPHEPEVDQVRSDMHAPEAEVIADLEHGDHETAARLILETVLGPGAWEAFPEPSRQTCVYNAPTWLDDVTDPTQGTLDLGQVAELTTPVLLTVGGRSDPVDAAVDACLAATLPDAARHTFTDAGHIPHLTHPDVYATTVTGFLDHVTAKAT